MTLWSKFGHIVLHFETKHYDRLCVHCAIWSGVLKVEIILLQQCVPHSLGRLFTASVHSGYLMWAVTDTVIPQPQN